MTNETKTPRTDAFYSCKDCEDIFKGIAHARQLETELAASEAKLAQANAEVERANLTIESMRAIERDEIVRLQAANAELAKQIEELDTAYCDYVDLLVAELNEVVPFASGHGWKTTRKKAGEKCRAAIDAARRDDGRGAT